MDARGSAGALGASIEPGKMGKQKQGSLLKVKL